MRLRGLSMTRSTSDTSSPDTNGLSKMDSETLHASHAPLNAGLFANQMSDADGERHKIQASSEMIDEDEDEDESFQRQSKKRFGRRRDKRVHVISSDEEDEDEEASIEDFEGYRRQLSATCTIDDLLFRSTNPYKILQLKLASIKVEGDKEDLLSLKGKIKNLLDLGEQYHRNCPYQLLRVIEFLEGLVLGHDKFIAELPTGFGKTVLFLLIAKLYGKKTLLLIPKNNLATQTVTRVNEMHASSASAAASSSSGYDEDEESGDEKEVSDAVAIVDGILGSKMNVLLVNKLHQEKQKDRRCCVENADLLVATYNLMSRAVNPKNKSCSLNIINPGDIGLVICDEGHSLQPSHIEYLNRLHQGLKWLVASATAAYETGEKGSVYRVMGLQRSQNMLTPMTLYDAIRFKKLCPLSLMNIDMKTRPRERGEGSVGIQMGDYDERKLSRFVNRPENNAAIVEIIANGVSVYGERFFGQQGVIHATNIEHADDLAKLLNQRLQSHCPGKTVAAAIHSKISSTIERKNIIDRYRRGEILILVGADMLVEGFDHQQVKFVVMNKPTTKRGRLVQMAGRGLRNADNKDCATIISVNYHLKKQCHLSEILKGHMQVGTDPARINLERTMLSPVALSLADLRPTPFLAAYKPTTNWQRWRDRYASCAAAPRRASVGEAASASIGGTAEVETMTENFAEAMEEMMQYLQDFSKSLESHKVKKNRHQHKKRRSKEVASSSSAASSQQTQMQENSDEEKSVTDTDSENHTEVLMNTLGGMTDQFARLLDGLGMRDGSARSSSSSRSCRKGAASQQRGLSFDQVLKRFENCKRQIAKLAFRRSSVAGSAASSSASSSQPALNAEFRLLESKDVIRKLFTDALSVIEIFDGNEEEIRQGIIEQRELERQERQRLTEEKQRLREQEQQQLELQSQQKSEEKTAILASIEKLRQEIQALQEKVAAMKQSPVDIHYSSVEEWGRIVDELLKPENILESDPNIREAKIQSLLVIIEKKNLDLEELEHQLEKYNIPASAPVLSASSSAAAAASFGVMSSSAPSSAPVGVFSFGIFGGQSSAAAPEVGHHEELDQYLVSAVLLLFGLSPELNARFGYHGGERAKLTALERSIPMSSEHSGELTTTCFHKEQKIKADDGEIITCYEGDTLLHVYLRYCSKDGFSTDDTNERIRQYLAGSSTNRHLWEHQNSLGLKPGQVPLGLSLST